MEVKMQRMKIYVFFFAICFSVSVFSFSMSEDKLVNLFLQNSPEYLSQCCEKYGGIGSLVCMQGDIVAISNALQDRTKTSAFQYLPFSLPGDSAEYLLLAWFGCPLERGWWKLLKTIDGGQTFQQVCEIENAIGSGASWNYRLVDLTADGFPELIEQGEGFGSTGKPGETIHIWQWKSGRFSSILPCLLPDKACGEYTSTYIAIDDLDSDGLSEVIVGPELIMDKDELGNTTWIPLEHSSYVLHYNGSMYVKWYEIDPNDPNPIYVPSLGAFHPSTLPLSELSNPGNGKIKVFISDPAGSLTADNFVTSSFEFSGTSLSFKKIWKNNKQPDESSANFEYVGCPVKQFVRNSQGEWQTNPSDPFILSPDQKMEYHFCGKYVELEVNRSAVFPAILQRAQKFFNDNPAKDIFFTSLPIRAKFENNKISQVSALVCIKKTGSAEADKTKDVKSMDKTTEGKK
jgi:hypothetical protein